MKRVTIATAVLLGLCAISACTEKPQTIGQRKGDTAPYEGPSTAFTAGKWKAGDETAWESQLRTRSHGQDDYSRAPS